MANNKNDILDMLNEYIALENPRKWAKLQSTITYRRLVLLLLSEILVELRAARKGNPRAKTGSSAGK